MCDLCGACREFTAALLFVFLVALSFGLGGYVVKAFLLVYATPRALDIDDIPQLDSDFWTYNFDYSLYFTLTWVGLYVLGWIAYACVKHSLLLALRGIGLCLSGIVSHCARALCPSMASCCAGRSERASHRYHPYLPPPHVCMHDVYSPQHQRHSFVPASRPPPTPPPRASVTPLPQPDTPTSRESHTPSDLAYIV